MKRFIFLLLIFLHLCSFSYSCNIQTNDSIFYFHFNSIEKKFKSSNLSISETAKIPVLGENSWADNIFLNMLESLGVMKFELGAWSGYASPYCMINKIEFDFIKQWYELNRIYLNCEKVEKYMNYYTELSNYWNSWNEENYKFDRYMQFIDSLDVELEKSQKLNTFIHRYK